MQEREARSEDNLGPYNNTEGTLTQCSFWRQAKRKWFSVRVLTVTDRFPEKDLDGHTNANSG